MGTLIKEEIFHIVKKKRFILFSVIAILGLIAVAISTKSGYWNDLTYYFAVQDYMLNVFNTVIGFALIISVYRRKFTKSSIELFEECGVARPLGVLARFISSALILIACYVLFALILIITGLIFGAHLTAAETGELVIRLLMDCLASISCYSIAQFWLYLFAFPVFPVIIYEALMLGAPYFFRFFGMYAIKQFKTACYVVPKILADNVYTGILLHNVSWFSFVLILVQMAVPLLLTMLVFKLKKEGKEN